jgi:phage-related tail protein
MRGERDDLSAALKADQERHAKLLADANRARDEAKAALEADKRKMEDLKSRMEEQAANLRHLEQEQSRLQEQN